MQLVGAQLRQLLYEALPAGLPCRVRLIDRQARGYVAIRHHA
jgi:hypothetical protein